MNEDLRKRIDVALAGIRCFPECKSELMVILDDSGLKERFISELETRVKYLKLYGNMVVTHFPRKFEKLQDAQGLYSMRFRMQKNIRIIYGYNNNEVLLLAFEEKSGKQHSNYTNKIPLALARLAKLKRG